MLDGFFGIGGPSGAAATVEGAAALRAPASVDDMTAFFSGGFDAEMLPPRLAPPIRAGSAIRPQPYDVHKIICGGT